MQITKLTIIPPSQRVDPNRIFWKRNSNPPQVEEVHDDEAASSPEHDSSDTSGGEEGEASSGSGRTTTRRPPSYASEDGVSYIIEARPRSTINPAVVNYAPEMIALPSPLPVHPSERGRMAPPPMI